jgi:hypothetical protein
MSGNENHRETGATKYPAKTGTDPSDAFSQDAAGNKKPKDGIGSTRPVDEVDDKTHQSDGQNPPGQVKSSQAMNAAITDHAMDLDRAPR